MQDQIEEKKDEQVENNIPEDKVEVMPEDKAQELQEQGLMQPTEDMAKDIKKQLNIQEELSPQEVMTKYLADPDVQTNARHWAGEFNKMFSGNWFTLSQVMKKSPFKRMGDAQGIMQIICLLNFGHVTTGKKQELKYKITLNPAQKIKLLEIEKQKIEEAKSMFLIDCNNKMAALDHEIEKLSSNLK